jgi:hypothetical protein
MCDALVTRRVVDVGLRSKCGDVGAGRFGAAAAPAAAAAATVEHHAQIVALEPRDGTADCEAPRAARGEREGCTRGVVLIITGHIAGKRPYSRSTAGG